MPGVSAFTILWLWTFRAMDWPGSIDSSLRGGWHSLGREVLSDQLWASLAYLHTQPPGLNALMGLDLAATPDSHVLLASVFASMGVATVFLVVDSLSLVGLGSRWAAGTGVAFALLPSAVIYMLAPRTTGATMFACALALWGVALTRKSLIPGVVASVAGVGLLFLFRASFVWVFVLIWIACLGVLVWRSAESRRQIGLGLGVLACVRVGVVSIEAHYVTSFGIWSTSSWAGENLIKATTQSGVKFMTPSAVEASKKIGSCEGAVAESIAGGDFPLWEPAGMSALPGCERVSAGAVTGVKAFDSPDKDGVEYDGEWRGNWNWSQRLAFSKVVTRVAVEMIKEKPSQLLFMAVSGSPAGARNSGVAIYLAPADDYFGVTAIRDGYPNKTFGGLLQLFFAPAAVVLTVLGFAVVVFRRANQLAGLPLYWFALGIIGYHIIVSTFGEYGENNRFQAEIAPALVIMSALVLWTLIPGGVHSAHSDERQLNSRESVR